jgi:hypothetical protein
MKPVSRMIAVALFAFLAACGGGNSTDDACENACACNPIDGSEAECLVECKGEVEEGHFSQGCIDCIAEASCEELSADACNSRCGASEEDKVSPEGESQLERSDSDLPATSQQ